MADLIETPLLVRAARREPVERTPVWFMRQAGRMLPEYRSVRERWTLFEICGHAELAAEVTLQPMKRMPLDAAVLFSDIMIPLAAVGVELDIVEGVGPVIASPVRDLRGVAALRPLVPEADVPTTLEAIRLVRGELAPSRAVLGFAGAPFTLASYLVEGRPSRDFARTKALMFREPSAWHELMSRLSTIVIAYLRAQVSAGADAVQLFDSWVGALAPDDYDAYVRPYSRRILQALADVGAPTIHFGVGTASLLEHLRDDGATVIGLDWRTPIDEAWARVGHDKGVQGNLDPAALLAPPDVLEAKALDILWRAGARPGHIFNLGHGILPDTPPAHAERLVEFVQAESAHIHANGVPDAWRARHGGHYSVSPLAT